MCEADENKSNSLEFCIGWGLVVRAVCYCYGRWPRKGSIDGVMEICLTRLQVVDYLTTVWGKQVTWLYGTYSHLQASRGGKHEAKVRRGGVDPKGGRMRSAKDRALIRGDKELSDTARLTPDAAEATRDDEAVTRAEGKGGSRGDDGHLALEEEHPFVDGVVEPRGRIGLCFPDAARHRTL